MISLSRFSLRLIRLWRMRERARVIMHTLTSNPLPSKEGEEVIGPTRCPT